MSALVDRPVSASHRAGLISVRFESGGELAFPIEGNPRLEGAADADLNLIEISPYGLHWPNLDEDLSFEGIRRGDYGTRARR